MFGFYVPKSIEEIKGNTLAEKRINLCFIFRIICLHLSQEFQVIESYFLNHLKEQEIDLEKYHSLKEIPENLLYISSIIKEIAVIIKNSNPLRFLLYFKLHEKYTPFDKIAQEELASLDIIQKLKPFIELFTAYSSLFKNLIDEAEANLEKIEELTEEKKLLENQLQKLNQEKTQLEEQLQELTQGKTRLNKQVQELTQEKTSLANQLKELTKKNNLLETENFYRDVCSTIFSTLFAGAGFCLGFWICPVLGQLITSVVMAALGAAIGYTIGSMVDKTVGFFVTRSLENTDKDEHRKEIQKTSSSL